MNKHDFRIKLNKIYTALCHYTDDVIPYDHVRAIADIKLRYSIILQAVEDLHIGDIEQQKDALEYFKGNIFRGHADVLPVPMSLLEKIIYSPEEYKLELSYDVEDDLESGYGI